MGRKVQRVRYRLDARGITDLPFDEIAAILRGADDLIMSGGRSMLVKILKGSREKKLLDLHLDESPMYAYYNHLTMDEIAARVDWVILNGYMDIDYDYRLPLLCYTAKGWDIERETFARELLHGFDERLAAGQRRLRRHVHAGPSRDRPQQPPEGSRKAIGHRLFWEGVPLNHESRAAAGVARQPGIAQPSAEQMNGRSRLRAFLQHGSEMLRALHVERRCGCFDRMKGHDASMWLGR